MCSLRLRLVPPCCGAWWLHLQVKPFWGIVLGSLSLSMLSRFLCPLQPSVLCGTCRPYVLRVWTCMLQSGWVINSRYMSSPGGPCLIPWSQWHFSTGVASAWYERHPSLNNGSVLFWGGVSLKSSLCRFLSWMESCGGHHHVRTLYLTKGKRGPGSGIWPSAGFW